MSQSAVSMALIAPITTTPAVWPQKVWQKSLSKTTSCAIGSMPMMSGAMSLIMA